MSVHVQRVFREDVYARGYEFAAKPPSYENVKTTVCSESRKAVTQISEDRHGYIFFRDEIFKLPNLQSFLRLNFINNLRNQIAGEDAFD